MRSARQHEVADLVGDDVAEQECRLGGTPAPDLLEPMVQDLHGPASRRRLGDDRIANVGAIIHLLRVEADRDDRFQECLVVQPRILAIHPVDGDAGAAVDQDHVRFRELEHRGLGTGVVVDDDGEPWRVEFLPGCGVECGDAQRECERRDERAPATRHRCLSRKTIVGSVSAETSETYEGIAAPRSRLRIEFELSV